jgi:hypothetical protein
MIFSCGFSEELQWPMNICNSLYPSGGLCSQAPMYNTGCSIAYPRPYDCGFPGAPLGSTAALLTDARLDLHESTSNPTEIVESQPLDNRAQSFGKLAAITRVPVSTAVLATCTIRSSPGKHECGSHIHGDYQNLAHHLRTAHRIPQVKLTRTRLPGESLITCPDEFCWGRHRDGTRPISQTTTGNTRDRTQVVNLVRHCMDKHLRGAERASCEYCGKTFSRRESRQRHLRQGCPNVSIRRKLIWTF